MSGEGCAEGQRTSETNEKVNFKGTRSEKQPEIQTRRPKERHTDKKRTIQRRQENVPRSATFQGPARFIREDGQGKLF